MWWELLTVLRPTFIADDEYQSFDIHCPGSSPNHMHFFMPEKMIRLDMLPVILVYIFSAWNNIFFSFTIRYTQARDFSGFYRNSGFLNFFAGKSISDIQV